jgi:hypothetical protein
MAKIRTGFVSNSSSSSFVIDANKYSEATIREYINILLDAHNLISGYGQTIDDICTIRKDKDAKSFFNQVIESISPLPPPKASTIGFTLPNSDSNKLLNLFL